MFTVDPESPVTLYEQLRTQIIGQVKSGDLIAGTKLPPVRQLADKLGVAPYTVARVYRLLEQDGVLETRGRNGTVVSARDSPEAAVQLAASDYADRARQLGIPADQAIQFVRTALGR